MMKITKQPLVQLVLASTTLFASIPASVFAATSINTPIATAVPYLTSVYGDITITPNGSLSAPATNAINIDTASASVIVNATNVNPQAIDSGATAVSIQAAGGIVNIGANSSVRAGLYGIEAAASASNASITNSGSLQATSVGILVRAPISVLNTSGTVTGSSGIFIGDGINLSGVTNSLTNSGTITTNGYGILIDAATVNTLINSGTITAALNPAVALTSGTISNGFNNSGTITGTAGVILISATSKISNGLINSGSITSTAFDAISLFAPGSSISGGILNSGNITAPAGFNAINVGNQTSNVLITNNDPGVITGDIIVSSNAAPGTVLQSSGTINGTVRILAAPGARTFNITGGSITGGIDISNSTPFTPDVINQSGGVVGPISGNIIGFGGGAQTLNILGPVTTGGDISLMYRIQVPTGGNFTINHNVAGYIIFNVPGGTVVNNSPFVVGGPSDSLNVTAGGSFTNHGMLDGDLIKVSGAGSRFINSTGIYGFAADIIADTGGLVANEGGTLGAVNLTVNAGGTFKAGIAGTTNVNHVSINSGTYEVEIQDPGVYGKINIVAPGVNNITNSTVQVDLVGNHLFQTGETYTIIDNTAGGTITHSFNIVTQPSAATVKFIDVSTAQDIILQVLRVPFIDVIPGNEITIPPATSIDAILDSGQPLTQEFSDFVAALDKLSGAALDDALETVVPQFDGGLVRLSHMLQHSVFEGLGKYIDEHRALTSLIPCYVAGDVGLGRWSGLEYSRGTWAKVFASRVLQKDQGLSDGYDLEDIGVILGYDQYCSDRVVLGGALSYATGSVFSNAPSKDEQSVKSFQFTTYSTYDFKGPGYLDVMAAVAFNNYDSTRNIIAGSFLATSTAEFSAWNYGVNLETGYRFSYDKYRIIPLARFMYSRLRVDNYTESGAGGLSLSVLNEPIEEGITALGIKFNSTNYYQEAAYIPEFRFNIIYDWINDGQSMVSNFLEGGPPFITNSIRPHPCIYNLGFSLSALASESVVFVLDYNMDLQRDYVAHNVSMKFRFEW